MRSDRSQPRAAAFTLIEMVLVLVLLATLLAMAAPAMNRWGRGAKLRDATEQLVAATRWARAQAIVTATPHRLRVDSTGRSYEIVALQDGVATPVAGEFGRPTVLPETLKIELTAAAGFTGGPADAIEFSAIGAVTPGTLRVVATWGGVSEITSNAPAEPYRLASTVAGGAR
jgi:type II secretory pathway pseudopilin PulG